MEKAYELFKNNDYTVSEVMYQVGINSNSYFTKTFKEYFNILPSEFIKQTYKKYNQSRYAKESVFNSIFDVIPLY